MTQCEPLVSWPLMESSRLFDFAVAWRSAVSKMDRFNAQFDLQVWQNDLLRICYSQRDGRSATTSYISTDGKEPAGLCVSVALETPQCRRALMPLLKGMFKRGTFRLARAISTSRPRGNGGDGVAEQQSNIEAGSDVDISESGPIAAVQQ